ncbi:DUF4034 domain-containing protein [Massilia horti]|uniref:DUF4034 domain-containing protein n=2 Tax=Massilia horti TaxID=2562153 RepID=A0A4Y9SXF9_9BURK|nr:DUF4034 domain-containing protein [Massilia horti]
MTPAWAEKPDPPITSQALWSLWWGDFDALEKQNAELRQPGHIAADGGSELAEFRTGIERILDSKLPHSEPYLRELEALTLQWATEHPKSALAHILHAQALLKHAWSYRGNGYAKEVPPEAWNDFLSYSRRAVDYLKAHADVALTDSYAHSTLLQIGMGLGWNARQLEAIAQDGLKRNPQDISLYFDIVTSLLPKWGGDVKTLDKYIRQVAQQTQADLGTGMYARLYSSAAEQQFGHALFEDSRADWPTMKKSWEDFLSRYPESPERRNRYAYMACLAKDKATLIAQLEQLGPKIDASQWGPNPERSLESCQRLAKQL